VIVVIAEAALADLVTIGRFIRQDNPKRAATFVAELRRACQELAEIPLAFPAIRTKAGHDLRRRRHGDYLIFYRVTDRVEVLHVLHGAQDYLAILDMP
jgi:toxin ParE1/3/4